MNQIPGKYFGTGRTNRIEGTTDESCLDKHPVRCWNAGGCIPSSEIPILLSDPPPRVIRSLFTGRISFSHIFPDATGGKKSENRKENACMSCTSSFRLLFVSDLQPFPILSHSETFNGQ